MQTTAFFPLAASLEQLYAFTALKDAALGAYGTARAFQTTMLRHDDYQV